MASRWLVGLTLWTLVTLAGLPIARAHSPTGTLTVAVATFGSERWLPQHYVGAEDSGPQTDVRESSQSRPAHGSINASPRRALGDARRRKDLAVSPAERSDVPQ